MLTGLLMFLFYTALFIFILYRFNKRDSFFLNFSEATLIFVAKIITGCIYGFFFLRYYGGDDTWLYHNEGLKEFALLKSDPLHFFINDIIPKGYNSNQVNTIFNSTQSFAKDLELTLLLKLFALFDLLSGGRYYVNVIFYNVLVFWGNYFLFKAVCKKYPEKRTLWLLFIFYFPPLLFWTSGLRKDGICFSVFCGLIYQLYSLFEVQFSQKRIIFTICLFIFLFLLRNYIALAFIPVIIAYGLSRRTKKYTFLIFSAVLICCAAMFFLTGFLPDGFNLPLKMADRQHAFMQLSGNSYLSMNALSANFYSYLKVLPTALNHVFIRPYFSEANGILNVFSFLEVLFFFFLIIRMIFKPSPYLKQLVNDPFLLSLIAIGFLNYFIIGYTVPFLGAIVRYKSSFEILFLIVLLQLQNISLNTSFFKFKKST